MKPKNPKSLKTALKYGWTKITVRRQENLSWLGITIRVDGMIRGRYLRFYGNNGGGTMVFENPADAMMVHLKFG